MRLTIILFSIAILLSSCFNERMARIPEFGDTPLFAKDNKFEYNTNVSLPNHLSISGYLKFLENAFIGGRYSVAKQVDKGPYFACILFCGPADPDFENYQKIYSGSLGMTDLFKKDITLMASFGYRQNDILENNMRWYGPEQYQFAQTTLSLYRNHAFKNTGGGFQYGFTTSRERVMKSKMSSSILINEIPAVDFLKGYDLMIEEGENVSSLTPFVKLNLGGRRFTFNTAFSYEFTNRKLSPLFPFVITSGITISLSDKKYENIPQTFDQ